MIFGYFPFDIFGTLRLKTQTHIIAGGVYGLVSALLVGRKLVDNFDKPNHQAER